MVESGIWIVIWSSTSIKNLKKAHTFIWKQSFSKEIADKVIHQIYTSTKPLKTNPYIYEEDRFKIKNDGSFRAYEKHNYRLTYKIFDDQKSVMIIRFRHAHMNPIIK